MEPKGLANVFCPGVHGYSVTTVCQNIDTYLDDLHFGDGRFKVKNTEASAMFRRNGPTFWTVEHGRGL